MGLFLTFLYIDMVLFLYLMLSLSIRRELSKAQFLRQIQEDERRLSKEGSADYKSRQAILYQTGQANLTSFKSTQWYVTYYAAAAFGALIAVEVLLENRGLSAEWLRLLLTFLAILVSELGIYFIVELQFGIREHRMSMNCFKKSLFQGTPGLLRLPDRTIERNTSFFRDFQVPLLSLVAILAGLALASYTIWVYR